MRSIKLVGALTVKTYAFKYRSWELSSLVSLNFFDLYGSVLNYEVSGSSIIRVLPSSGKFISDIERFSFEAFEIERLQVPLVRYKKGFKPVSWEIFFSILKKKFLKIQVYNIKFISVIGKFLDLSTLFILNFFLDFFNSSGRIYFENEYFFMNDLRRSFLIESNTIKKADVILLVLLEEQKFFGLFDKLRSFNFLKSVKIFTIGFNDFNESISLGSLKSLNSILQGKHHFCQSLMEAKLPLILIGEDFFKRFDSLFFFNYFKYVFNRLSKTVKIFNCFSGLEFLNFLEVNRMSMFNYNNLAYKLEAFTCSYFLNIEQLPKVLRQRKFFCKIYQGCFFTKAAQESDFLLPVADPYSLNEIFLNCEGKSSQSFSLKEKNGLFSNFRLIFMVFSIFNFCYDWVSFYLFFSIFFVYRSSQNFMNFSFFKNWGISLNFFKMPLISFMSVSDIFFIKRSENLALKLKSVNRFNRNFNK